MRKTSFDDAAHQKRWPPPSKLPLGCFHPNGVQMIQFVCESCAAVKQASDVWIVGLAAESVGVTAARREVAIQSAWDRQTSIHPLAVHFCSVECKDNYMARLFAPDATAEVIVERSALEEAEEMVITTTPLAEVPRIIPAKTRMHGRRRAEPLMSLQKHCLRTWVPSGFRGM
jgi:hypothetical protein